MQLINLYPRVQSKVSIKNTYIISLRDIILTKKIHLELEELNIKITQEEL